MNLIVTGGYGFIGSNFIHYYLNKHPNDQILNIDCKTYAGWPKNLEGINWSRCKCREWDISCLISNMALAISWADAIIHFAAESHVDRSITGPSKFMETNIMGTFNLLELVRTLKPTIRFLYVSTDEVYGELPLEGKEMFTEQTPLDPHSPYSVSKTAADLLCQAYHRTYGLNTIVTRCCNNYGPFQFPEKLIPVAIFKALDGKKIPVYGQGLNVRDWIYVEDHCSALDLLLHKSPPGEVWNIGSNYPISNINLVKIILRLLKKDPENRIEFVTDRLGHDLKYAIDATKLLTAFLEWRPKHTLFKGLEKTIKWYQEHRTWWKKIESYDDLSETGYEGQAALISGGD